jgi:cyclic pyranopterin phosphate synthase
MADLTHFDAGGASRMVDVGDKPVTRRLARASARLRMAAETLAVVLQRQTKKGDVLEVARLAGIMAAKRTADLIPLCHPLAIDSVAVDFTSPDDQTLVIGGTVAVEAKTGVEMEALTVVSVAALTVYDMCKSLDRGITIERIQLEEKSGGRSGHWRRRMTNDE